MNEILNGHEEPSQAGTIQSNEDNSVKKADVSESVLSNKTQITGPVTEEKKGLKKKISKTKLGIIGAIAAIVIIALVIALAPSEFDKVESECVHIAGIVKTGKGYFTIETMPDSWENMDSTTKAILLSTHQQNALDAIKYANEELGFPGVYFQMLNTSALMGLQSDENKKYKVTWTYHPDDGLTVTYSKK